MVPCIKKIEYIWCLSWYLHVQQCSYPPLVMATADHLLCSLVSSYTMHYQCFISKWGPYSFINLIVMAFNYNTELINTSISTCHSTLASTIQITLTRISQPRCKYMSGQNSMTGNMKILRLLYKRIGYKNHTSKLWYMQIFHNTYKIFW